MPSFQLATTFLGQPCGIGWTEGVNPEMRERLQAAERTIRAAYDAAATPEQTDAEAGDDAQAGDEAAAFERWAGVSGPHLCWLPNAAQHSAGAAIDINPAANPYIVTRHGDVPGGEPGGDDLVAMRRRALAVFDRAMRFAGGSEAFADVEPRRPGEATDAVWRRFKAVSDALAEYLRCAVDAEPAESTRVALENADEVGDDELLAAIPEGERLPLDGAVAALATRLGSASRARAQYVRIVRDYELVRIPLVIGAPSATPARTRNPARGFLHLPREIVTALCDQGLRWGACDFPIRPDGTSENGAMMHFDLADSGGYPEINSLLRFG